MNEDLLSSNIWTRKKELKSLYPSLNLDFFIEKKQLEAWLISDIDCLVSILWNHKYIPYKKITNPTDSINDPLGIISSLFRAKWMTYKKQLYESKIWKGFSPAKSINSSFKYFYTTIKSY
jgi:hypothetical protein